MSVKERGFASMDPQKQREIASRGGKAAHEKGTAHEFTSEEAKEAGRKGRDLISQDIDVHSETEKIAEFEDFQKALFNQKQLILQLQELLAEEIKNKADSERVEEFSSALEDLTEGLNNLIEYFEFQEEE